jgi:hypothetical protein
MCALHMTVSEPQALRVSVRAIRARAAGCPQRFARCVATWCDAQRRVVERCDAPRRVALPTVMSISPTRLIDYAKTWRGREATSRQRCCRIVFIFVSDSMRSPSFPSGICLETGAICTASPANQSGNWRLLPLKPRNARQLRSCAD